MTMSAKRVIVSLAYGFVTLTVFGTLSTNLVGPILFANYERDGLGPAFFWLGILYLVGFAVFVLGLFGKLPGTK